jgi:phenylacetate-CoA ligase
VPEVRCIITTYELLTGSLRDLLQKVFRCEVYSQYGASELPDIANECEQGRLHLRSNNVLLEVIRDGRPAAPGQVGRAVVTDLRNYNMPLIRYDIGDVVMPGAGPCACGRNNETIEAVHGRAGDLIRPDGSAHLLTPLQVDEMFRGVPGIAAYRLVQRAENLYHVEIMRDAVSAAPETGLLTQRGRNLFGEGSQFRIDFVDAIKPLASKKFRFVYSELSPVAL